MIAYILEVTLYWTFLYCLYFFILRRLTFFTFNRYFLLLSLCLGLIIPLIKITWESSAPLAEVTPYFTTISTVPLQVQNLVMAEDQQSINWTLLLLVFYWSGVLISLIQVSLGLFRLRTLYKKSELVYLPHYTLVRTPHLHVPFSFFHWVFWSKDISALESDEGPILAHELAHVNGWHSLDILFVELVQSFMWCSPPIYFYRHSLRSLHEYLADQTVLRSVQPKPYGQILIKHADSQLQIALANHFIQSQLKNRIMMMFKQPSHRRALWQYALIIPALLCLLILVGAKNSSYLNEARINLISAESGREIKTTDTIPSRPFVEEVFKVVEDQPRFPGCEQITNQEERANCAKEKLLEFIYKNLLYPQAARDAGIEGQCVVKLVVEKDGSISNLELLKDIGGGCGDAALQAVATMNNMPEKWIPGRQRGVPVRVQYLLPVKFKIESAKEPLLVVFPKNSTEGIIYTNDEFAGLPPEQIINITVLKDNAKNKYPYAPGEGVIEIRTNLDAAQVSAMKKIKPELKEMPKESTNPRMIIFPNNSTKGKIISQNNYNSITDHISKVDILKGDHAKKKYPDAPEGGVVEIYTDLSIEELESLGNDQITNENASEVFKVVEEQPRFPGCEQGANDHEKDLCSKEKLLHYIYNNIKYPSVAREAGIQGQVVIRFVVETDGTLSDLQVVKEIGGGCGDAALAVFQKMNQDGVRWTPGKQRQKNVRVIYNVPVKFKLENGTTLPAGPVPTFAGCAANDGACSHDKFVKYIYENIHYPEEARKAQNTGLVKVYWTVDVHGKMTYKAEGDVHASILQDVKKVFSGMPAWKPAVKDGQAINYSTTTTIAYILEGQEKIIGPTVPKDPQTLVVTGYMPGYRRNEPSPPPPPPSEIENNLTVHNFRAYPNPAQTEVKLEFSAPAAPVEIMVVDVNYKRFYSEKINAFNGTFNKVLPLASIPDGHYFIIIRQGDKNYTHQLVLKK